jgi:hypothetical protein
MFRPALVSTALRRGAVIATSLSVLLRINRNPIEVQNAAGRANRWHRKEPIIAAAGNPGASSASGFSCSFKIPREFYV